jgi:hypothetical protein
MFHTTKNAFDDLWESKMPKLSSWVEMQATLFSHKKMKFVSDIEKCNSPFDTINQKVS